MYLGIVEEGPNRTGPYICLAQTEEEAYIMLKKAVEAYTVDSTWDDWEDGVQITEISVGTIFMEESELNDLRETNSGDHEDFEKWKDFRDRYSR